MSQIRGLGNLLAQLALVDAEHVGEPVGHQLLADGRVVVLAMVGAGLVLGDERNVTSTPLDLA